MCNCKSKSGQTSVLEIIPVATGTTTASPRTFYVDLVHHLCRNRKICISAQFPLSGTMRVTAQHVANIGTNLYSVTLQLVGTVSYIPYVGGCNSCEVCPVTETVFTSITVPMFSTTAPVISVTQPTVVLVTPTNVKDCCSITNAVEMEFAFNIATSTTAQSFSIEEEDSVMTRAKSK